MVIHHAKNNKKMILTQEEFKVFSSTTNILSQIKSEKCLFEFNKNEKRVKFTFILPNKHILMITKNLTKNKEVVISVFDENRELVFSDFVKLHKIPNAINQYINQI